jgi:hypothetical protein
VKRIERCSANATERQSERKQASLHAGDAPLVRFIARTGALHWRSELVRSQSLEHSSGECGSLQKVRTADIRPLS